MNNLPDIKVDDTNLFLVEYKNTIYSAIEKNKIITIYDLFTKYETILFSLNNNSRSNDKEEFIAILKLLRYKYLSEELYFDLDKNFSDCKNYKCSVVNKLQTYGISTYFGSNYNCKMLVNNLYDKLRVIDIVNNILNDNELNYSDLYTRKLFIANKNRALILKNYYDDKKR